MTADFVLDALEQAFYDRKPAEYLVHHSDRGSQYVSIRYTDRLAKMGIVPLWAVAGILMITLWLKPSMACIRLKSFTGELLGKPDQPSNW